jgi:flagellar biosynthesis/type III secretory pathway protein FliH
MDSPNPPTPEKPARKRRTRMRGPQGEAKAAQRQIAAMVGMGMSQREIAKKTDRTRDTVKALIKGPIARDEGMQAIIRDARARLAPQAIDIAEKLLHKIRDSTDGIETVVGREKDGSAITRVIPPPLREQASALREVANVAGLTREAPPWAQGAPAPGLQINFNSAETVASFVEALRMLNEPSGGRVIEVKAEEG